MAAPLSTAQLRQAATRLPRVPLAHLPTPLEDMPRLSKKLGGPQILIKRDDCTGLLFGGNKTRHNEFLFGEALRQKADVLVWGAGTQSNNCRQTAAACAKLGLDVVLYLSRVAHNDDIQGNLLLDHLLGAEVHCVDIPLGPDLDDLLLAKAEELRKAGRRPFCWDRVSGRPIAAVSYALCLAEMVDQLEQRGAKADVVYCSAAGATGAGLLIGKAILGWPGRIKLISPIKWPWSMPEDMAEVANQTARLLDLPHRVAPGDVDVTTDFIGPVYGELTPGGREAMNLVARNEGILLDPSYTGKCMAGLIADIRQGRLRAGETAVFVHTGGTPAVFAYRDELMATNR